jgi:hypothetical protein
MTGDGQQIAGPSRETAAPDPVALTLVSADGRPPVRLMTRTLDSQPTPVPELMAQIRDEGGLGPWLSSRVSADRLAEYDAALEREAEKGGPLCPPRPPGRAERKRALTVLPGGQS